MLAYIVLMKYVIWLKIIFLFTTIIILVRRTSCTDIDMNLNGFILGIVHKSTSFTHLVVTLLL